MAAVLLFSQQYYLVTDDLPSTADTLHYIHQISYFKQDERQ